MAAGSGTVRINLIGDSRSLQAALTRSEQSLAGMDQSLSRLNGGLERAFNVGAVLGGATALSGALISVATASDTLAQSRGAVSAIFKEQAASMDAAASAAVNLGLSQSAYNELAVTLGAQLRNLGTAQDDLAPKTQGLITLAADMAAQFNTGTAQAVEALTSAFKGESDPIEAYGVSLNETAIKAEMAATGLGKAQAIMAIITRQTADAAGAAAREQDGAAASMARMQASFENAKAAAGSGLAPALATAADAASKIGQALGAIPQPVIEIATNVLLVGAAMKGAIVLTETLAARMAAAAVAQQQYTARNVALYSGSQALGGLASAMGSALPVIGLVAVGLFGLGEAAKAATPKVDDLKKSIVDAQGLAAAKAPEQTLMNSIFGSSDLKTALDDVRNLGIGFNDFNTALSYVGGFNTQRSAIDANVESLRELAAAGAPAAQAGINTFRSWSQGTEWAGVADELQQVYNSVSKTTSAATAVQALAAAFKDGETAAKNYADATALALGTIEGTLALDALKFSIQGVTEELLKMNAAKRGGLGSGNEQGVKNQQQILDWVKETDTAVGQLVSRGYSAEQILPSLEAKVEQIKAFAKATGASDKEIQALLEQLGIADAKEWVARFKAAGVKESQQQIDEWIASIGKVDGQTAITTLKALLEGDDPVAYKKLVEGLPPSVQTYLESIRKGGVSPEEWTALLAKIPKTTQTELLFKWAEAQAALERARAYLDEMKRRYAEIPVRISIQKPGADGDNNNNGTPDLIEAQSIKAQSFGDTTVNAYARATLAANRFGKAAKSNALIMDPAVLGRMLDRVNIPEKYKLRVPVKFDPALGTWTSDYSEIEREIDRRQKRLDDIQAGKRKKSTAVADAQKAVDDIEKGPKPKTAAEIARRDQDLAAAKKRLADAKKSGSAGDEKAAKRDLAQAKEWLDTAKRTEAIHQRRITLLEAEKARLEAVKEAADQVAASVNALDIGDAYKAINDQQQAAKDNAKTLTDELARIDEQLGSNKSGLMKTLSDAQQGRAEAWNDQLRAYWDAKVKEAEAALASAERDAEDAREKARRAKEKADADAGLVNGQPQTLRQQLEGQIKQTKDFTAKLTALQQAGVSKEAIQSIIDQGVETGSALADQLLADPELARFYSTAQSDLKKFTEDWALDLIEPTYKAMYKGVSQALQQAYLDYEVWLDQRTGKAKTGQKIKKYGDASTGQPIIVNFNAPVNDPDAAARAIRKQLASLEARSAGMVTV